MKENNMFGGMGRLGRPLGAWASIAAILFLSPRFLEAHVSKSTFSHIDVYYDESNGSSVFNLECIDISAGMGAEPSGGASLVNDVIPAIDFNAFSSSDVSPRTAVLFVVRNSSWPGLGGLASLSEATLKIKRRVLKSDNTLSDEEVRLFSFPNVNVNATDGIANICASWDGSFFVDEKGFGKVNGVYTAEATIKFSTGDSEVEATLYFPGDGQFPIAVDVMDIHSVVSSPTVYGSVAALPVNLNYKLSKSALVTIDIFKGSDGNYEADRQCIQDLDEDTGNASTNFHPVLRRNLGFGGSLTTGGCNVLWSQSGAGRFVRRLVDNQARWGEDTTQGKLGNSESWDGKDENGNLVSSGTYVFQLFAWDTDSLANLAETTGGHAHDIASTTTFSVAVDPLQLVNLSVQGLDTTSTGYAGISFQLTEAATVYFSIWQASAAFLENQPGPYDQAKFPIPDVYPLDCLNLPNGTANYTANCPQRIRRYVNVFPAKQTVSIVWDGRDEGGRPVEDGNYVATVWAAENETYSVFSSSVIKTSKPKIVTLPVTRGFVPLSAIAPVTTSLSSPAVTGLEPFYYNYSLGRDAYVNLRVKASLNQNAGSQVDLDANTSGTQNICTSTSGCTVAHLVQGEIRSGGVLVTDPINGWDGRTVGLAAGNGVRIASGSYMIELTATDTLFPTRISTITTYMVINLLRTSSVGTSSIISSSSGSATISYVLSEAMGTRWNIYSPTSTFSGGWPNLQLQNGTLVRSIYGLRPGRIKITETWDGTDEDGLFVEDGNYIAVLISSDVYGNYSTDQVMKEISVARGQILFTGAEIIPTFPSAENSSATLNIPLEPFEITYTLSRDAYVTIDVNNDDDGTLVKRLLDREPRSGLIEQSEFWDGTNTAEIRLTTGTFLIDITAEDQFSVSASSNIERLSLFMDNLKIYDVAATPLTPDSEAAEISYQLS
ncbi:MAG: hypothetical protein HY547_10510, partial [Elusimicrobia bacterium]|nr:hypothetical protein [Elusimicrobiota bacterium]